MSECGVFLSKGRKTIISSSLFFSVAHLISNYLNFIFRNEWTGVPWGLRFGGSGFWLRLSQWPWFSLQELVQTLCRSSALGRPVPAPSFLRMHLSHKHLLFSETGSLASWGVEPGGEQAKQVLFTVAAFCMTATEGNHSSWWVRNTSWTGGMLTPVSGNGQDKGTFPQAVLPSPVRDLLKDLTSCLGRYLSDEHRCVYTPWVPACVLSGVWLFATAWTYSLPGSTVQGIFQARILERVAISFSKGSFWPRE